MTSNTQITLKGKDNIGARHEILVRDCPENPDWFIVSTRMEGDSAFTDEIALPKIFIPALTETLKKLY